MNCTFFGNDFVYCDVKPQLERLLRALIENHIVINFYVGDHGNFDGIVRHTLKKLKAEYPHINYAVVLAYMPKEQDFHRDYSDTIFPEGFERFHPKYAIYKRNMWMLNQSHYVVTFVKCTMGGAAHFKEMAEKRGKTVINLAPLDY